MDEFSGVHVRDFSRMFEPRESASVGRRAVVHVPRSGVSRLLLERTPTKTTKEESGRKGGGGGKGDEKRRKWRRRVYRRERGRESVERSFVSSSSFVISDDAANVLENSTCFRNQNEAVRRHKFLFAERKRESSIPLLCRSLSFPLECAYLYLIKLCVKGIAFIILRERFF